MGKMNMNAITQYFRSAFWCGNPARSEQQDREREELPVRKWSLDRVQSEALERRLSSRFNQNLVTEDFTHNLRDFYDLDAAPILGAGASGAVRLCSHRQTGIKYAIKTLTKRNLKPEKIDSLRQEIRIMAMLDHPNVLSLHECFENAEYIYLVLELCTGGELLIKLNSQPHHHFSEAVACRYVRTIIECIAYLHEHSIVHRDLKLENFIFVDDSENSELKLIDFGLSKHFDTAEVIHGAVGTPFYVAPEVLTNCYSPKCDVWSIGVIAFMLLAGYPPFDGEDDRHTLHLVRTQPVKFEHRNFKTVSPEAIEFIRACLNRNVEERPEAKDLMSFPWIAPEARRRPSCALTPQVLSALHGFCRQRRFVKISLEVIAHTLTNEQVSVLRKQFSEFDIRHQGKLCKVDLKKTLLNYGSFSPDDIDRIFAAMDVDGDCTSLRYHEFLAAALTLDDLTESNLRAGFLMLSKHEDLIDIANIRELLGADFSEVELTSILEEVGLSADAPITYQQFTSVVRESLDNTLSV